MFSPDASRVLGGRFIADVSASDLYEPLRSVIENGWVLEEGAVLLAAFRNSYVGSRSRYPAVLDWELAVNGRGIPDEGLTARGVERVRPLMRRGVTFAWEALRAAGASIPEHPLIARVSASEVLMNPGEYTGHVTFFSAAFGEAMRVGRAVEGEGVQVYMFSQECVQPLTGHPMGS